MKLNKTEIMQKLKENFKNTNVFREIQRIILH